MHQQYTHADVPATASACDLKLCHDLSHHLLQPCLNRNSAPHPTNSRSFIVLVAPLRLCHRHHTTVGFLLHRDSRLCHGLNRRRLDGTHRIRLLSSILRVSLVARNSVSPSAAPADLTTLVFQFVSVENFTSTLFTSPSSLVRSLLRACVWIRSWLQSSD